MNEQVSWIFYRYAIGAGTLLLGIASLLILLQLWRIACSAERIARNSNIIENQLYGIYMFTDRIEHNRGRIHVKKVE